jgi:hypothetical protein
MTSGSDAQEWAAVPLRSSRGLVWPTGSGSRSRHGRCHKVSARSLINGSSSGLNPMSDGS